MCDWNRLLTNGFFICALFFSTTTAAAATELSRGEELYKIKCTKCHKLREPTDYDDEKWRIWMDKMKEKAHLSQDQYEQIARYCDAVRAKSAAKG